MSRHFESFGISRILNPNLYEFIPKIGVSIFYTTPTPQNGSSFGAAMDLGFSKWGHHLNITSLFRYTPATNANDRDNFFKLDSLSKALYTLPFQVLGPEYVIKLGPSYLFQEIKFSANTEDLLGREQVSQFDPGLYGLAGGSGSIDYLRKNKKFINLDVGVFSTKFLSINDSVSAFVVDVSVEVVFPKVFLLLDHGWRKINRVWIQKR